MYLYKTLSYCLECWKSTAISPKSCKDKKKKIMLSLKFTLSNRKKSRYLKKQEANGLLSSLELKRTVSKIPLLHDILL